MVVRALFSVLVLLGANGLTAAPVVSAELTSAKDLTKLTSEILWVTFRYAPTVADVGKLKNCPKLQTVTYDTPKLTDAVFCATPDCGGIHLTGTTKLTDASFKHLAGMSKLDSVGLEDCGHCASGITLLNGSDLKYVRIRFVKTTGTLPQELFKALAGCGSLKSIELYGKVTQIDEPGFAELAKLPDLRRFTIGGFDITTSTVAAVAALTQLTSVLVEDCPSLVDEDLKTLAAMPALDLLSLDGCRKLTIKGLESLKACKTLKTLGLMRIYTYLEADIKKLQEALPGVSVYWEDKPVKAKGRQELEKLPAEISNVYLVMQDAKDTEALSRFSNLLSLEVWAFDDPKDKSKQLDVSGSFKSLAKLKYLEVLEVHAYWITDATLKDICAIPALRSLNLQCASKLTPKGWSSLKSAPNLEWLSAKLLSGVDRSENLALDSTSIAEIAKAAKLKHIEFYYVPVKTKDVAKDLQALAQLKSLDYLDIVFEGAIGDDALGVLPTFPSLTHLRVETIGAGKWDITDEGLKQLEAMKKLQHLYMPIEKSAVSEAAKASLKKALGKAYVRLN